MGILNMLGITKKEPKLESGYHYLNAALELIEADEMEQAYDYLIIAAEKGYDSAYVHLGWMFLNGEYVEQDLEMAEELLLKAANAGEAAAYYYLASMIIDEQSNIADEDAAIDMLHYAADEGFDPAQQWIAEMYFTGDGLPLDHIKAKFYTQRAAIAGNENAINFYNDNKAIFNSIPDMKVDKKESKWASKSKAIIADNTEPRETIKMQSDNKSNNTHGEDRLIWGRKCCGTCEHWHGKRDIIDNRTNVIVETHGKESIGRCMHSKYNNMTINKPHNQLCNTYTKWTVIR